MPNMNPACVPPISDGTCDASRTARLQSEYPDVCVSGGFDIGTVSFALFSVSGSGWTATISSTYVLSCVDGKWNMFWDGGISSGNEDATSGVFPDLVFPSFATFIAETGTCSWCGQCLGPVSSMPATLYWHNQTTSQEVTLSHDGGYEWSDSTNTYSFFCDAPSVSLMASDGTDTGIETCNNSDPINYTFTISGETVVINTIAP